MVVAERQTTPNYIMLRIDMHETKYADVVAAEKWCQQTGCGKKVNYKTFAFKTNAELTMFTLKWL